ncbi:universal stress protein [Halobacteriales archaeon QS_1_68_20]|nr:MAG: universal stress protein [Halobacteriales archaeon QS_1_68_20]
MYDSILVPTDGSAPAETAVEHAIDLAADQDATVHALYVVDQTYPAVAKYDVVVEGMESEGEAALDAASAAGDRAGVPVERHLRRGVPHEVIVDAADDYGVDLVVMGTNGRTGLDRIVSTGSVTERVVRLSTVPVLAVGGAGEG